MRLEGSQLKIIFLVSGLFLILEGLGSFIVFSDQNKIFEYGRIARIALGFFLLYLSAKSIRV